MSLLQAFSNQKVLVVTLDGRVLVTQFVPQDVLKILAALQGTLLGTDQNTNIILQNCEERAFSMDGTEVIPLGLYLIRGDSLCTVGLLDEEKEAEMDITQIKAEPLASTSV